MKKMITHSQRMPSGYGVAYCDYDKDQLICYPFGLHLLIGWLRDTYWKIAGTYNKDVEKARSEGYNDGYFLGYKYGRKHE